MWEITTRVPVPGQNPKKKKGVFHRKLFHRATSMKSRFHFSGKSNDVHMVDVSKTSLSHYELQDSIRALPQVERQTVEIEETVPISAANLKGGPC